MGVFRQFSRPAVIGVAGRVLSARGLVAAQPGAAAGAVSSPVTMGASALIKPAAPGGRFFFVVGA